MLTNNQLTFNTIVTIAGLYLIFKQRSVDAYHAFASAVHDRMVEWDKVHQDNGICDKTLLCTRVNARHREGCLAKW